MTGHGLKDNKPAGLDRAWRGRALTFEPLLLAVFACLLINPPAQAQQNALRPVFDTRDDTITLLARGDPASSDRLTELYNTYRQALGGTPPH